MQAKNSAGFPGNVPKPMLGHRTSQDGTEIHRKHPRYQQMKKWQACETAFRGNGIDGSLLLVNVCPSYRGKLLLPSKRIH